MGAFAKGFITGAIGTAAAVFAAAAIYTIHEEGLACFGGVSSNAADDAGGESGTEQEAFDGEGDSQEEGQGETDDNGGGGQDIA